MRIDREQELLNHLQFSRHMSLSEAMTLMNISESTARRLFAKLEYNHLAIRTHGGIQLVTSFFDSYSFEHGAKTNIALKTLIGQKACSFVTNGDVIFCDSGTTIRCFCHALASYIQKNNLNVRFYTNSLANLEILAPYADITLIGGKYRINRKDFCGYLAEQSMNELYFNKCFIGADGYTHDGKFTTTDFETARLGEIAIRNSKQSFLLADSSKFMVATHIAYAPAEKLEAVITDSGISEYAINSLNNNSCRIIYAAEGV